MSAVTYHDGIATILGRASKTEVDVLAAANIIREQGEAYTHADVLALAAGYEVARMDCHRLQAELIAARAGTIGREHAKAMQDARKVLAELNAAVDQFLAVYDQGEAPDSTAEGVLRSMMGAAFSWLVSDSTAASARAKVLKGGA